jgi:ppGpp synthetase/RelA/SpoT-type nucleotidyltranferase
MTMPPPRRAVEEALLPYRTCRRLVLGDILEQITRGGGVANTFLAISRLFVRVKSADSILEKMERKGITVADASEIPARMTDILGFRIIVENIEELRAIQRFVEAKFEVSSRRDQVEHPSEFGERGVRYSLRYSDGASACLFEIQVRTFLQQCWASRSFHLFHKKPREVALKRRDTLLSLSDSLSSADRAAQSLSEKRSLPTAGPTFDWKDLPLCSQVNLIVVEPGELFSTHVVIRLTGKDSQDHEVIVRRKVELYASHPNCAIVECSCLNFLSFLLNEPLVWVPLDRLEKAVL